MLTTQPRLQINFGDTDHAIPTLEGCLKGMDGKFHSTQNAVRLHGWLRGTEVIPPVIEAVRPNADNTTEQRIIGNRRIAAYPDRWYSGQLLRLEQILLALPAINEVIGRDLERTTENMEFSSAVVLAETTKAVMEKVGPLYAFNASAMFFQYQIPERLFFEDIDTLHVLFTCVITQRDRIIYEKEEDWYTELPLDLYNQAELDKVISRIHNGILEGFFPHPATQARADGLIDESFYRQCAMAFSNQCRIPIPRDYIDEKPTRVFHWACFVLNSLKDEIPSMRARPKLQNVVSVVKK